MSVLRAARLARTVLIASALLASPALAETLSFTAEMSGDGEGMGIAEAQFDTETNVLSWRVMYSGLSGPATAAHVHGPANPGENAGIVIGSDSIEETEIAGSGELTEAQVSDLKEGRYYVNIHTELQPGGEIRGHLTPAEM